LKGFFKALAVKEMRTFGIILARMIPMHVTTNNLPTYPTEEQMRAELRAPPRGRLAAAEQYHPAGARTQEHVDGVDAGAQRIRLSVTSGVTFFGSERTGARERAGDKRDSQPVTAQRRTASTPSTCS
jgi:hypothetical protein